MTAKEPRIIRLKTCCVPQWQCAGKGRSGILLAYGVSPSEAYGEGARYSLPKTTAAGSASCC